MQYIIDRWEGGFAVCEGENLAMVEIPRDLLPEGCTEGSKIETWEGGYRLVDNAEDKARIQEKLRRLLDRKSRLENAGEYLTEGESQ